jgi:hypothetical protein
MTHTSITCAVLELAAAIEPGRTDTDPRMHDGRPLAEQAWDVLARGEAELAQAAVPSTRLTHAVATLREMLQEQARAVLALAEALDPDHQGDGWPDPIAWDGRPLGMQARDLLVLAENEIAQHTPSSPRLIAAVTAVREAS